MDEFESLSHTKWECKYHVVFIWKLIGGEGKPYHSKVPGTLGGHRRGKIYGRLDCRCTLSARARGGYVTHRAFFLDEAIAAAAGYRPCAVCLPRPYAIWKSAQRPRAKKSKSRENAIGATTT